MGLAEAQLDFILEMHSLDNPETFKFERTAASQARTAFERVHVGWANVLIGKGHTAFMAKWVPILPVEFSQKPEGL